MTVDDRLGRANLECARALIAEILHARAHFRERLRQRLEAGEQILTVRILAVGERGELLEPRADFRRNGLPAAGIDRGVVRLDASGRAPAAAGSSRPRESALRVTGDSFAMSELREYW